MIEIPSFSYHRSSSSRSQGRPAETFLPLSPTVSSVSSVTRSRSVSSATLSSESAVSATLVDVHEPGPHSPDMASLSEILTTLSLSPTPSSPRGTDSNAGRPPGHHNVAQPGDIPFPTPDGEGKTYEIGIHTTNAWFVPRFSTDLKH